MIEQHNLEAANGDNTFTLGLNKYSDLTAQEIQESMNGFKQDENVQRSGRSFSFDKEADIPDTVDWRKSVQRNWITSYLMNFLTQRFVGIGDSSQRSGNVRILLGFQRHRILGGSTCQS